MCWKYKNPHGHVFIWCDIENSKPYGASYLRSFQDMHDDYYRHYNYCPYCGKELEVKDKGK